jgi:hypothetical protein
VHDPLTGDFAEGQEKAGGHEHADELHGDFARGQDDDPD